MLAKFGTLGQIRTDTVRNLNPLPLPDWATRAKLVASAEIESTSVRLMRPMSSPEL